MTAKDRGRILTEKQAADLAKQAGKYFRALPRSQKGITVKGGSIRVDNGRVQIVYDEGAASQ